MSGRPNPEDFVTVKTTLPAQPFPPHAERQPIVTERLIIRPLAQDDLAALHALRTQPEVMYFTMQGRPDADLAETQAKLDLYLPPKDTGTYNLALCLKETGELVGIGGHHGRSGWGWPEIGYMLRKEQWGKGLATEFLHGFLRVWEKLPRAEFEVPVDPRTVLPEEGGLVPEQLFAITEISNSRSQNVLRKSAFEDFIIWQAEDNRNKDAMIDLPTFRFFANRKAS